MIDHVAYFACRYVEDETPTEEEMRERLDIAEYYLDIPFDRDENIESQYQNMCEICFKRWDSRPVVD